MRIGFLVNDVETEEGRFATSRLLGRSAVNRGREVWVMEVGDLEDDPDGLIRARAASVSSQRYGSPEAYTADLQGKNPVRRRVFSPGGLGSAQQFEKVNFSAHVVEAVERKVQYIRDYGRNFDNVDMCTL